MTRLQTGIMLCLLCIACIPPPAQSKEDNLTEQQQEGARLPTEPDCGEDLECYVNFALLYDQFVRRYPPSAYTVLAATVAEIHYLNIAKIFRTLATNPEAAKPAVAARYAQYSRDALLAKANQYATLAEEFRKHAEKYEPLRAELFRSASNSTQPSLLLKFLVLAIVIAAAVFGLLYQFKWLPNEQTRLKLINIDGAEQWSSGDRSFRLHELRRYRLRNEAGLRQRKLDEVDDAIYRLEQRKDDTSSDTIIGYQRD